MGLLRLWLAIDVLNWHDQFSAALRFPHSFAAVGVFFVISGFYMALQLDTTYAGAGALPRFYLNRILRLYPIYLLTLGIMAALAAWRLLPPYDWGAEPGLLENLTLLPPVVWYHLTGQPGLNVLILGQMSTVGLELMFYAIAPLIVRLPFRGLLALFVASAALHFLPAFLGLPERPWQYEFFPAILVFFVAGTLSYRAYRRLDRLAYPKWIGFAAVPLILLYSWRTIAATSMHFTNDPQSDGLYLLAAMLLPFLFAASRASKWDRLLGDLSYPLYVVHVPVIWFVQWNHLAFFGSVTALTCSILVAVTMLVVVERPIDRIRSAIRRRPRLIAAEYPLTTAAAD